MLNGHFKAIVLFSFFFFILLLVLKFKLNITNGSIETLYSYGDALTKSVWAIHTTDIIGVFVGFVLCHQLFVKLWEKLKQEISFPLLFLSVISSAQTYFNNLQRRKSYFN